MLICVIHILQIIADNTNKEVFETYPIGCIRRNQITTQAELGTYMLTHDMTTTLGRQIKAAIKWPAKFGASAGDLLSILKEDFPQNEVVQNDLNEKGVKIMIAMIFETKSEIKLSEEIVDLTQLRGIEC